MTRKAGSSTRGFFIIGVERSKTEVNVGTLWRTAHLLGAAFIFTIGRRYKPQASDATKAWRSIPLLHFDRIEEMRDKLPHSCPLVGVELDDRARPLHEFTHPERAAYLLGAEDHGLSKEALGTCHALVKLPGRYSMNVAVAGSIVMYDRVARRGEI